MNTNALVHLPEAGPPDLLFLVFHGVGSNAAQMAGLATRLAAEYPQAAVACLDGPEPFDGAPEGAGRQWFSVQGVTEDNRPARVAAALPRFVAAAWSAWMRRVSSPLMRS